MDHRGSSSQRRRRTVVRGLEGHRLPLVGLGLAVVAALSAASAIAAMSVM